MTIATILALLSQNQGLITLAAGWLGGFLHSHFLGQARDATHQKIATIVQNAVMTGINAAVGNTPNGANGDK